MMELVDPFGAFKNAGLERLNNVAARWLETPTAKECAVKLLRITEKDGKLHVGFGIGVTHRILDGESYHFPFDNFLEYLCEYGISNAKKRQQTIERYRMARENIGRSVFQHFGLRRGFEYPLGVKCKTPTCVFTLETDLYGVPGDVLHSGEVISLACGQCGKMHDYKPEELRYLMDRGRPVTKTNE